MVRWCSRTCLRPESFYLTWPNNFQRCLYTEHWANVFTHRHTETFSYSVILRYRFYDVLTTYLCYWSLQLCLVHFLFCKIINSHQQQEKNISYRDNSTETWVNGQSKEASKMYRAFSKLPSAGQGLIIGNSSEITLKPLNHNSPTQVFSLKRPD